MSPHFWQHAVTLTVYVVTLDKDPPTFNHGALAAQAATMFPGSTLATVVQGIETEALRLSVNTERPST